MDIYRYLILNDSVIGITVNEEKEGYVTLTEDGSPVDWTQYKLENGVLVKIGVIPPIDPPIPPKPTIEQLTIQINAKYQPKLDSYKDYILSALAADGSTEATKKASFSAKYNALLAQKNAELEALYNG